MNFGWKFLDDYEEFGGGGSGRRKGREKEKERGKEEGMVYIYISIHDKRTRFQTFFFSLLFTMKFAVYKQTVQ